MWQATAKMARHEKNVVPSLLWSSIHVTEFLITLASLKSPVAGLPERDRAYVTFFARQRICAHHDRNRIEVFNRLAPRMTSSPTSYFGGSSFFDAR
jgi:hypothetical protein